MNTIGTQEQQARFAEATKQAVRYLDDPNAPEPLLFAALQEFHDAKSDMIGYFDGWVLNKSKVRRRFTMSGAEASESTEERAFRRSMEKSIELSVKAAHKQPASSPITRSYARPQDIVLAGSHAISQKPACLQAAATRAKTAASRSLGRAGAAHAAGAHA